MNQIVEVKEMKFQEASGANNYGNVASDLSSTKIQETNVGKTQSNNQLMILTFKIPHSK